MCLAAVASVPSSSYHAPVPKRPGISNFSIRWRRAARLSELTRECSASQGRNANKGAPGWSGHRTRLSPHSPTCKIAPRPSAVRPYHSSSVLNSRGAVIAWSRRRWYQSSLLPVAGAPVCPCRTFKRGEGLRLPDLGDGLLQTYQPGGGPKPC
eukprot:10353667-Alexandrium_andersonii.AAC.1